MSPLKDRLAQARTESGLSQAQLAKAVGAGQSTIASIESGRNKGSSLFLDLARALNVNVEWLMDGSGPKRGAGDGEPAKKRPRSADWPFSSIPEDEVRALGITQLSALEGAIALAIAQLKLGINVSSPVAGSQAGSARSPLTSLDAADDPFPMRIDGLAAEPWNGGKTTSQAERENRIRISTQTGVIANVGLGETLAANDGFQKVPELADVRLAAGDGIENYNEDQTGMVQFRRSFLKSVGADNGNACVVYAKGDSMEPVIRDGAALLVVPNESLTLRDVAAGGVYAINYDGKMIVKTVTRDRLTKRWVARSFNPAYQDIPLESGTPVRVLGQVVWSGARLKGDEGEQWVRS
ncbi:LexA family transcriptional regulator [Achromobacter anxifer]|uniref:LexA family transcriptional regulator n=1 Tax=Achromobacter anxifer TaxID=1287737 RepID=UPI0015923DFD|nr:LexA family transcriptional regulator [Achromobacter anxifer]MDF8362173.1 LexA family transcriptional regulator [Achromobacter anxifer]